MIQFLMRSGGVESICLVIFMVYNHWMKRERNIYNNSRCIKWCIYYMNYERRITYKEMKEEEKETYYKPFAFYNMHSYDG